MLISLRNSIYYQNALQGNIKYVNVNSFTINIFNLLLTMEIKILNLRVVIDQDLKMVET